MRFQGFRVVREHEEHEEHDQASRGNYVLVFAKWKFFSDRVHDFKATIQEQEYEKGDDPDKIAVSGVLFRPDHEYGHRDADVQEQE